MKETTRPLVSIFSGVICFALLTMLDQITKQWAIFRLRGQESITLIQNVFQLYYLENHGAAFGILQGRRGIFIVITVAVLVLMAYAYLRLPFIKKYRMIRIFLTLISAGAVGNFIDRVSRNYVVDFFYFVLIDFPVFNVADIYVTCSTVLLIIVILFRYKDEDFSEMFQSLRLNRSEQEKNSK